MVTTEQAGQVDVAPRLDDPAGREVAALLERAGRVDGGSALNEAGWLNLRSSRPGVSHLRLVRAGRTLGYAQLDDPPGGAGPTSTGQVVVDPEHRRTGVGTALVRALRAQARYPLHVWAIGDTAAAAALAARTGLVAVRTLLIMTRTLTDLPAPVVPDGVTIDTFAPDRDAAAWLAVNRQAFAHHPEQGAITAADLALRVQEPWFDPEGFFLARDTAHPDGPLLGFHWTKTHGQQLGEVYVIGVAPQAEGRGLAKALLLTGLAHLRDRGATTVELYVESDSVRAVGLYVSRGFAVSSRDVMYGEAAGAAGATFTGAR